MTEIDLLVGLYSFTTNIESQATTFLESLRSKCNLKDVNVICAFREHRPISKSLKTWIRSIGFEVRGCSLPAATNCQEDTSLFCNWMVDNLGSAPWVGISHYDVEFQSDYIT